MFLWNSLFTLYWDTRSLATNLINFRELQKLLTMSDSSLFQHFKQILQKLSIRTNVLDVTLMHHEVASSKSQVKTFPRKVLIFELRKIISRVTFWRVQLYKNIIRLRIRHCWTPQDRSLRCAFRRPTTGLSEWAWKEKPGSGGFLTINDGTKEEKSKLLMRTTSLSGRSLHEKFAQKLFGKDNP